MLFRNKMEPCCEYCTHSIKLSPDRAGCLERGVVLLHGACSKFVYDPLKRKPERPRKMPTFQSDGDELFTL